MMGGVVRIGVGSSELGRGQEVLLDSANLWCEGRKLGKSQKVKGFSRTVLGQAMTVKGNFLKILFE